MCDLRWRWKGSLSWKLAIERVCCVCVGVAETVFLLRWKFALACPFWKQSQLNWNFNTMWSSQFVVNLLFPVIFNFYKITALWNMIMLKAPTDKLMCVTCLPHACWQCFQCRRSLSSLETLQSSFFVVACQHYAVIELHELYVQYVSIVALAATSVIIWLHCVTLMSYCVMMLW